jgi:thiamine-phosphate diphosphorylase
VTAAGALSWIAITPGRGDWGELREKIPALAAGGIERFLLREKQSSAVQRRSLADKVNSLCVGLGVECWLVEDAELVAALGASGVHLSESSPAPSEVRRHFPDLALSVALHRPLSRSAQDLAECRHAYLSPVFQTPSKPGVVELGVDGFADLQASLALPVYALGGINAHRATELRRAGVRFAAAMRLFFDADQPEEVARRVRGCARPELAP